MTVFVDPVDGVPFTDADGFDDRTLWLRAHNGVGELVAATEPVWLIDARRGPVDQLGGVDPVPVTGSLLNPTDGALQSVSTQTNEGSAGASLWSTPHDAGMVPAVSVSMRARCRSVADPTTGATTAQAVWLRKTGEVDADAVGSLPPSDLLQIGAWSKWDRVLTAGELAVLPVRLGA